MNATVSQIDRWIEREDYSDGEDYFIVTDGEIEIMDQFGDSATIYASEAITEILQNNSTGEVVNFQPQISIPCDCGECEDVLVVHSDGTIEIEREGGDCYTTKIDPRYCSAIYRHITAIEDKAQAEVELEAERQAEAYSIAENNHYYSYFQQEILAEFAAIEANELH